MNLQLVPKYKKYNKTLDQVFFVSVPPNLRESPGSYAHDIPVPINIEKKKRRNIRIVTPAYVNPVIRLKKKDSYEDSEKLCGISRWCAKKKAIRSLKADVRKREKQAEEWRRRKLKEKDLYQKADIERERQQREDEYIKHFYEIEKQRQLIAKKAGDDSYPYKVKREVPKFSFNKEKLPKTPYYPKHIKLKDSPDFEELKKKERELKRLEKEKKKQQKTEDKKEEKRIEKEEKRLEKEEKRIEKEEKRLKEKEKKRLEKEEKRIKKEEKRIEKEEKRRRKIEEKLIEKEEKRRKKKEFKQYKDTYADRYKPAKTNVNKTKKKYKPYTDPYKKYYSDLPGSSKEPEENAYQKYYDKPKEKDTTDIYKTYYDKPKYEDTTDIYKPYKTYYDKPKYEDTTDIYKPYKTYYDKPKYEDTTDVYKTYYDKPTKKNREGKQYNKLYNIKSSKRLRKRKNIASVQIQKNCKPVECTFSRKFVNCFYKTCCELYCCFSIFLIIGFALLMFV